MKEDLSIYEELKNRQENRETLFPQMHFLLFQEKENCKQFKEICAIYFKNVEEQESKQEEESPERKKAVRKHNAKTYRRGKEYLSEEDMLGWMNEVYGFLTRITNTQEEASATWPWRAFRHAQKTHQKRQIEY